MNDPHTPLQVIGAGKFLELVKIGHWEAARRIKGSTPVGIVAVTPHREILLISQFRVPVGKVIIEIPAGLVADTDPTETWQAAAMRELREETGYAATGFEQLTLGPTSAGLTSECIRLVWAMDVKKAGPQSLQGDEQITLHLIPLAEVDAFLNQRVAAGELIDPKVYAALYFASRRP
jgi:ADP-ribose pyrophosphatase